MHAAVLASITSFPNNYSCEFDGTDDKVSFGATILNPNNDFTFEAWVYLDTYGAVGRTIFEGETDANNYWILFNYNPGVSPTVLTFQYQNNDVTAEFINAAAALPLSTWTHIALTRSGNVWQWYINGVASGSPVTRNPAADFPLDTSTNQNLGFYSNVNVRWDGKIDEVRIWDTARTADQIANNRFRNIVPAVDASLIHYYRFEEGSGTTATDEAGANNGSLDNGATYSTDTPY